ncbi:GPI ethanolamine phosphate transferase 1 [Phtheirospermum japonicum]|uniref:GPI ethanolamine phosphate transferase 1 n=1 Tax=Phtheirospermum japonicum TaxID=374723 RepID=A0A830CNC7_9LAMI|nr:GPI ethanolamine phosphate transferase 1 [Phtheirospermum japonicum]
MRGGDVYMLSIFDIYFKSPIVHGMEPVKPRFSAPAKRLVLLVADGLRADKFFEPDSGGNYRAPFLRSVIKELGRWGVSHARPPTESRPGHVAIIAGFYEDPSAVTKDQFQNLLNRSNNDPKLKHLLQQNNLVIFLHLLGCDSNGHAHRPYSPVYLNNVKVVDHIAERVYNLVQSYFKDNSTAYVFTADHGMSDKGSHGDGHPTNTDTPLVAWGAGVGQPVPISEYHNNKHDDVNVKFVDDHAHDMATPSDWGLDGLERLDVNQADIAPLMSTLLGLPCPVNSVGNLPLGYVNFSEVDAVEAVLANTKEILNQFLRKSRILYTGRPFWFAACVISLGYLGWMIYLIVHVLQSYTALPEKYFGKDQSVYLRTNNWKVYFSGCLLIGLVCTILLIEHSPPLYHAYFAMTIFLWVKICCEYRFLKALWRYMLGKEISYFVKFLATFVVSVFILEILVKSFTDRKIYTWSFLLVGVIATVYLLYSISWNSGIPFFVWLACWFLSVFTLMPAEIPDNTKLVCIISSPTFLSNECLVSSYFDISRFCPSLPPAFDRVLTLLPKLITWDESWQMAWACRIKRETQARPNFLQGAIMALPMDWKIVLFAQAYLAGPKSPLHHGPSKYSPWAGLKVASSNRDRIEYEAVFYGALALALMAWILFENISLYINKMNKSSSSIEEENLLLASDDSIYTKGIQTRSSKRLSQKQMVVVGRFSSGVELANILLSSGVLNSSWDAISDTHHHHSNLSPSVVKYKIHHSPNGTIIIAFVGTINNNIQAQDTELELVSSQDLNLFDFVATKVNPVFSIHKATLNIFLSLQNELTLLRNQLQVNDLLLFFSSK